MTAEEVKNGIFGSWASSMVATSYFRQLSVEHLCVGHTHEDVGALAEVLGLQPLRRLLWLTMQICETWR